MVPMAYGLVAESPTEKKIAAVAEHGLRLSWLGLSVVASNPVFEKVVLLRVAAGSRGCGLLGS